MNLENIFVLTVSKIQKKYRIEWLNIFTKHSTIQIAKQNC